MPRARKRPPLPKQVQSHSDTVPNLRAEGVASEATIKRASRRKVRRGKGAGGGEGTKESTKGTVEETPSLPPPPPPHLGDAASLRTVGLLKARSPWLRKDNVYLGIMQKQSVISALLQSPDTVMFFFF